jgi:Helix-turn-helix domain
VVADGVERRGAEREAMADRLFLSVAEFGEAFGVGPKRANELVHAGAVPHVRLGRRIFIPRRALDVLADDAIARVRERPAPEPVHA